MRVLVIGSGGREHALAWAFARSSEVTEVIAAPGNPGIEAIAQVMPAAPGDPAAIAQLADTVNADLVVIGPEDPLVNGAVDAVRASGRLAFGPEASAARLEGSKAWMKSILVAAGVPTAGHATFTANKEDAAYAFLDTLPGLYVIKTDGLASGKGVLVTESLDDARAAVREYLSGAAFGDAGTTVVIEEGLTGPELSLLAFCDGTRAIALAPAQDFKRLGTNDTGPNTGGMGAYSPVPDVTPEMIETLVTDAIEPTLAVMHERGMRYQGVLYAGLMLTPDGPKILEYNVRFGDPECQVIVPRLASDLAIHCHEVASGSLQTPIRWRDDACVTVVLASEGYPAKPRTGDVIEGLEAAGSLDDVLVFHAGTRREGDQIVTSGGRVLGVTALGASISDARERAYKAANLIRWPGMQQRDDIAEVAAEAGALAASDIREARRAEH